MILRRKYKIIICKFLSILIICCNFSLANANDNIEIYADLIELDKEKNQILATGNVIINHNNVNITSDKAIYNKQQDKIQAQNNVKVSDDFNNIYFTDNLISNEDLTNLSADNIKIRLKDNSRIVGSSLKKIDDVNIITDGQYTPCSEDEYLIDNCPGWKLKAKNVFHNDKTKTIHYDHSILYIMNVPILYTPYFSHPDPSVNKRTGLLPPSFQADDNLGQIISLPYFYNINSNKDLTFTPTFQSTDNNYITTEYRHLNESGLYSLETNINDNQDKTGSKHYIFANAELSGPLSQFDIYLQTVNNDTYMRKNQINEIEVLTSGFTIADKIKGNNFLFETKSYKHLSLSEGNQWEYIYPKLTYDISNLSLNKYDVNLDIRNEILRLKSLNKDTLTSISSEFNLDKRIIDKKAGVIYDSFIDARAIHHSINSEDIGTKTQQLRIFPQFGSTISFPLKKTSKNFSQVLKPIIMPILAPYNNYTGTLQIDNSNIFSSNRASNLSQWESGPRMNYGFEWYGDSGVYDGSIIIGQSLKFNKNKEDTSDEISDFMTSATLNLNEKTYSSTELVIDRKTYKINKANIASSLEYKNLKLKAEYDYDNFENSEQFGLSKKFKFFKNLDFVFSGKRDLQSDFTIGYEAGILYENDCLAINFKYYRDLTKFKDIEDTKGLSLLITLKPFGSSKEFGKSKIFGPQID